MSDPTGHRHVLTTARSSAEITQVGAALRALRIDGVDLVPGYPDDVPAPAASGTVLVPWPNRVRDGRWTQRGVTRQLALTEPQLGNASHGLLRFTAYAATDAAADRVALTAVVYPQTGYPFQLETSVEYRLREDGLTVVHRIRNVGVEDAPVALGTHPYFLLGGAETADLVLTSTGARRVLLDDRKLPVGTAPVDAAADLRTGRRVGDLDLDTAYTDLARGADGRARHTLAAPDGRRLEVWQGPEFDWVQVFTTDRYPGQPLALAIEPMSAAPDAFNSGDGLRWLSPGAEWSAQWGVDAFL